MTNKRKVVRVDEEKIKMMMAGDIPMKVGPEDIMELNEHNKNDKAPWEMTEEEKAAKREADRKKSEKGNKKNKEGDYKELFVSKPRVINRRQRTIHFEEELYSEVLKIAKISGKVSVADFINNLVKHHLEAYEDDINKMKKEWVKVLYRE